jgi:hypothetical protein
MQEILINGSQLVLEDLIQVLDDSGITFHISLPIVLYLIIGNISGITPPECGAGGIDEETEDGRSKRNR